MDFVRHGLVVIACAAAAACVTGASAASSSMPTTAQPALSAMAQPYAGALRDAGIKLVLVRGSGARVRTSTQFGDVNFRYPAGLSSTEFAVHVDGAAVRVDSDAYSPDKAAQYEAAMKAVLPEAIRRTNDNNSVMRLRQMTR